MYNNLILVYEYDDTTNIYVSYNVKSDETTVVVINYENELGLIDVQTYSEEEFIEKWTNKTNQFPYFITPENHETMTAKLADKHEGDTTASYTIFDDEDELV